ncbi:MAG: hypothetical protein WCT16_03695 [Candidatus Buchananbacteria bacterium]
MELRQRRFLKQGHTRFVVLIPCLGIAIKIAKINFFKGLHRLFIEPWEIKGHVWYWFKCQLIWNSLYGDCFRHHLFRGINANWQEFWFYLRTRHRLLQPTYFSFLGLFNIQKIASAPLITKNRPYFQFYYLSPKANGEHNFDSPENFCLEYNHLKILDYGDIDVREAVLADGDKLSDFDPDWDYEEYKKRRPEQSSASRQAQDA